ncbi:hypothetical protein QNI19_14965 [Cytophagaceae bacterium DM2B3-1]|uniref:Uncharacterized protein n=1 Tax=Xanthocytophaga flava TaxID=3048013 RepID=A0ABT7CKI1_9BACT|nr:hypothetical protein [Xanthocytophaga flavus]MDJ1494243.1 hypothetical protein [Xanthocytophaga flavus]
MASTVGERTYGFHTFARRVKLIDGVLNSFIQSPDLAHKHIAGPEKAAA